LPSIASFDIEEENKAYYLGDISITWIKGDRTGPISASLLGILDAFSSHASFRPGSDPSCRVTVTNACVSNASRGSIFT
jgi:hypothetical protein